MGTEVRGSRRESALDYLLSRQALLIGSAGSVMFSPLAGVTQLVEYLLPKQAVAGSSPVARSTNSLGCTIVILAGR